MAQLSSEPEPMPFIALAQTSAGALKFIGDKDRTVEKEFGMHAEELMADLIKWKTGGYKKVTKKMFPVKEYLTGIIDSDRKMEGDEHTLSEKRGKNNINSYESAKRAVDSVINLYD